jgi:AmmeMemoRadiSam system protein B
VKRLALPLVPLLAALLALLLGLLAARAAGAGEAAGVRAPAFAGSFYPDDPARLRAAIEGFLADARPPRGEAPVALVAPHAGYLYSGQIAADAYRQALGSAYDVVVILGTNHAAPPFDGVSVDASAGLRTPLGVAAVDVELARALAAADGALGFRPEAHAREHSIEVQVPFVQVALPRARIVAAVVGRPGLALAERFGRALARALAGRRALIVASSDLSHYPPRDAARAADLEVLAALATLDAPAAAAASRASSGSARAAWSPPPAARDRRWPRWSPRANSERARARSSATPTRATPSPARRCGSSATARSPGPGPARRRHRRRARRRGPPPAPARSPPPTTPSCWRWRARPSSAGSAPAPSPCRARRASGCSTRRGPSSPSSPTASCAAASATSPVRRRSPSRWRAWRSRRRSRTAGSARSRRPSCLPSSSRSRC